MINLDTVPPVPAPIITMARRTSDTGMTVAFAPNFQDGWIEVTYYVADIYMYDDAGNVSSPDLVISSNHEFYKLDPFNCVLVYDLLQTQESGRVRATLQQSQASAFNLEACNDYWVVVTAVHCGRRSSSEPKLTGFYDATSLEVSLSLRGSGYTCGEWMTLDSQQKLMDMETALRRAEASCTFGQIPCFRNSMWVCSDEDSPDILFR